MKQDFLPNFQSASEVVVIAALVLIALFATIIGFPFWPSLGFSFALGVVFYLIQTGGAKKEEREDNPNPETDKLTD